MYLGEKKQVQESISKRLQVKESRKAGPMKWAQENGYKKTGLRKWSKDKTFVQEYGVLEAAPKQWIQDKNDGSKKSGPVK